MTDLPISSSSKSSRGAISQVLVLIKLAILSISSSLSKYKSTHALKYCYYNDFLCLKWNAVQK